MFTLLCGKFIQDTTHEMLPVKSRFRTRYGKTFWLAFFLGHSVYRWYVCANHAEF